MAAGADGELRTLEAEILYTPPRIRRAHIERLTRLIPELQQDRLYTYEYIFHRITLFAPDSNGDAVFPGRVLQRALGRLLRRLSLGTPLNAGDAGDEVLQMQAVAAQCRVTLGTVKRWGLCGLSIGRYSLANGYHAWGVRRSALELFLAERRRRAVAEGRRMTEEERRALLRKAQELSQQSLSPSAVARRLAEETGHSASSICRLLRRQVRAAAGADAKRRPRGISGQDGEEMVRLYRGGMTVRALAQRLNRSSASVYRALHEALMRKVLSIQISYIPNPVFAAPAAAEVCLGAQGLFTYPPEPTPDMPKAPAGLPPYLAELYAIPLLSREQEKELFRKYNYIKYLAAMLQEKIRRTGYRTGMLERFEQLREATEQVRRILIRCNLRLVVSIAKRHVGPLANLLELVSEGNLCLMRAVECYDFAREARFSTYATWAISKHFARVVPEENYRLSAFITGQQERLNALGELREQPWERSEVAEHLRTIIARAAEHLTARERAIIESHYGTDGRPARTLQEIGDFFGLTRERIRQIEARSLAKLRSFISPEAIEGVT